MFADIDPRSPTPLYEQIAARVRMAIASGELAMGESLPSVRALARELRINPATVVQAYRDLAADAFVELRHGQGTFVREVPTYLRAEERAAQATRLVRWATAGRSPTRPHRRGSRAGLQHGNRSGSP